MPAPGIFISGTDTDVGKTIVAATIARVIARKGIKVGIMKPVTSGCSEVDGKLVSEDAALLKWGAQITSDDPDFSPYCLQLPVAPSVAATREGVRIDFSKISEAYQRLSASYDFIIVEGAGGLMVPLSGGLLVADLIKHLKLPVLVVTRPNLGTINHTVLTCFAARQMDIDLRGIIINRYPEQPDVAEEYAPHLLDSLSGAPILGLFPSSGLKDDKQIIETIADKLMTEPATKILLREIGID